LTLLSQMQFLLTKIVLRYLRDAHYFKQVTNIWFHRLCVPHWIFQSYWSPLHNTEHLNNQNTLNIYINNFLPDVYSAKQFLSPKQHFAWVFCFHYELYSLHISILVASTVTSA
jgi:hypothetical protein